MAKRKLALVTGCTSGIGLETVRGLAAKNFDLILLSRSEERLQELKAEMTEKYPVAKVEYFVCDFSKLSQVVAVAKLIAKAYTRLDVLINNAGIWERSHQETDEGFELTWAVNYFAPFLLTYHLMPVLLDTAKETKDVRIINLSSEAHRFGVINFDDFYKFSLQGTYGGTKLANMLHTFKLARDLRGTGILVNCVHPGVVSTKLWRRLPKFVTWLLDRFLISPIEGASTTLAVATVEGLTATGQYYMDSKVALPKETALDEKLQDELYNFTLKELANYLK